MKSKRFNRSMVFGTVLAWTAAVVVTSLPAALGAQAASAAAKTVTASVPITPVAASNLTPGTAGMALRSGSTGAPVAPQRAALPSTGRPSDGSPSTASQTPAANAANNLIMGSGPSIISPTIYNVFWLPSALHYESAASAASDTSYENLLNRWAGDLGGTDYYNIVTQYPGSNGTPMNSVSFGGSWVDTTAYPHTGTQANPLSDADIQGEATAAAGHFSVTPNLNRIFLVYTAFNIFECQTSTSDCNFFKMGHANAYCAYHFDFGSDPTVYAFMGNDAMSGDPGGCSNGVAPNGDAAADAEISSATHEFIESVTDPEINNWLSSVATGQQEIGDLCNRNDGPHNVLAPGADVYLHGHPYDVQQQWSNAVSGCATDLNPAMNGIVPPALTITKSAPATAVTAQQIGYSVTVTNPSDTDAAQLTAVTDTLPAGVSYVPGSASSTPSSTSPLTWSLGTLAVHDSTTITFDATSNPATVSNCAGDSWDDQLQISSFTGGGTGGACAATVISRAATTTVVSSDHNPSVFGQPVTLSATVTVNSPGSGTPTGMVSFLDGASPLGSCTLMSGSCSLSPVSSFSVTTHSITATYGSDPNFLGSTSAMFSQVVKKAPTTTTLTANPSGSAGFGGPVTFTATVAPAPPSTNPPAQPTGNVQFLVDGASVQTVGLNASQQASVTTSALLPGSHMVTANYGGDGNFDSSTASISYLVTCSVTITGNHSGAIQAAGHSVCIVNAVVTGQVSVAQGTSVAIVHSKIGGSITATTAPGQVEVCSSTIGGSVSVFAAQHLVAVGDPGDLSCGVNAIKGTLALESNTNGVEAIGNTVGNLVAFGNSGPGPYPGDSTTIAGNIIVP
ncbi:MAG: Ig-like domain repeat protein [Acidimicrobiales bacterium]